MAVHDHVLAAPQVEMADPHLLVDQGDEVQHLVAPPVGHLQVEGAGDVQGLDIGDPGEGDVVFGPASGHGDRHLVVVGPVEGPFVERSEAFQHIERVLAALDFEFDVGHADPSAERAGGHRRRG